jgi:acyl carrier protein
LPQDDITASQIQARCIEELAKALGRPPDKIDPHAKFARLGVDSAMAVYLVMELEDWLGMELAPDVVYEYPTAAELSKYLAEQRGNRP